MQAALRVLLAAALLGAHGVAAADPLGALDFLLGTWRGAAAGASGTDQFQRELDGAILERRSQSVSAAADGKPSVTKALLTVFPTGGGDGLAAIYFDSEGHVIHYGSVTVGPGQRVTFESDAGSGPRFRLTYALEAERRLHVRFEMAPPGASDYRLLGEASETAAP